ncbi:GNAT family N-acetyltransferase [Arthrobacter sp. ISL-95]|uniref:GNAT family N-acetyltransferase n=1 Tax=Arthrobacter sp. ISL-95 TaxID=2819116 RepID=UPI001BE6CCF7|nr:GNAT family N-acetyltransferase [Arthrobacter sp. ISL-95]MBT2588410.1 GNAT family N-acetyltransferase [Arthrobacter sp. ISL-95]
MLIRAAPRSDASPLSQVLNRVVDEGDKTAINSRLTGEEFTEWFLTGSHCVSCMLAQEDRGRILGFQVVERFHDDLPKGMAAIATFVSQDARGQGGGTGLIDQTMRHARTYDVTSIRAVIRRTNRAAVRYYRSVGFLEDAGQAEALASVVLIRRLL